MVTDNEAPSKAYFVRWESDDLKIGDSLLIEGVDMRPVIEIPCRIVSDEPSLEDQIKDMQPEDDVFYSKEMLEGYEMAKADVLALIELWNEEW